MSQLIIANMAAPFVLSQTGSIWLFVSIIPVEMLVVFLCLKLLGTAISFFRLFEVVLAANIATTMLGIFRKKHKFITLSSLSIRYSGR
jgi:hypothetical protein